MLRSYIVALLLFAAATTNVCADDETGHLLTLKTADNKPFSAYRVGPRGARIGILLIHESWGLSDPVREWADWLARNNYRVVAVDLYDGRLARDRDEAMTFMTEVKQSAANAKYRAAIMALRAPGRRIAVMGWEFGGAQALQAALALPAFVSAAVVYDAPLITDSDALARLRAPVLGIFAKDGAGNAGDKVRSFEATMRRLKRPVSIYQYERAPVDLAGHFYSEAVAERFADETAAFFKRYLK